MLPHAHMQDAKIVEVELRVKLSTLLVHCIGSGCFIELSLGLAGLVVIVLRDEVRILRTYVRICIGSTVAIA